MRNYTTHKAPVNWERVRVAIFDIDGTLYDQRRLRRRMVRVLLAHCLINPQDARILRILHVFRRTREELADAECENIRILQYERPAQWLGISAEAVRTAVETWMYERPLPYLRPCRYPGVEQLFRALTTSGRTIAILSDHPCEDKLRALELHADVCISAVDDDTGRLKPHPACLWRLLDRVGAESVDCVLIGDRDDRDGECARRVGMTYLLKTGHSPTKLRHFTNYHELASSVAALC